jgi:predicted O-methyltransferase YrrM
MTATTAEGLFLLPDDVPTSLTPAESRKLYALAAGNRVLELGAWQGHSTICLAQSARIVHSVDTHTGDPHSGEGWTLPAYLRHIGNYGLMSKVVTHIGRFGDIVPLFREQAFDLIFVDGYHSEEAVEYDVTYALPRLRDGGVICFHDYTIPQYGVRTVVDRWFREPDQLVDSLAVIQPDYETLIAARRRRDAAFLA